MDTSSSLRNSSSDIEVLAVSVSSDGAPKYVEPPQVILPWIWEMFSSILSAGLGRLRPGGEEEATDVNPLDEMGVRADARADWVRRIERSFGEVDMLWVGSMSLSWSLKDLGGGVSPVEYD